MAPLQTHRAHCGACSGLMVLQRDYRTINHLLCWIYWYVCQTCGTQTPPCLTTAEADNDVVWVPMAAPKRTEGGGHGQ